MKTRVNFFYALFVLLATVFFTFTNTMAEAGVAAPSSLEAVANSSSRINLTWRDNSNNESGFHIWRYDSSWSQIAVLGANRTSYSDTGLSASAKYRYALRAYDSTGTSSWSNIVSEATLSGGVTAPAAPSNLTAGAVSSSQINLSWQDDAGNESGFHIWRYDSSWKQIAIVGANRTSYSDTGLSTSTTCRYAVRAYNSAGASRWSNVVSATTSSGDVTIPAVPSSLTADAVSSSQINISWQDNANNESGFKIERASSSSGPWSQIATLAANLRSYANAGLSASTTYYYRVRAYNPAGNSSYSNTAGATTLDAVDTTAPTVSITSPSSGATYTSARTVSITASASDNKGVTRVDFLKDGAVMDSDSTNDYSTTWSIDSADNGTHSWTARAYDAAGNVKTSSYVSLTVNIAIPDTTPPTVSITSPSSGATYTSARTVTITASASDDEGVTRVDFLKDGAVMDTDSTNAYSTTWSIDSADNGTHSWTARAYDAAGNSRTCTAVSLTVNIPVPDTTPPNVSITSPQSGTTYTSARTVGITAAASDNVAVSKVEFYQNGVMRHSDASAPYSHSWAITSADNDSHIWTAKAYDAAGNNKVSGAVSLTVNIPVPDTTAPGVSITSPQSGTTYTSARTVGITASASDNVAVSKVEFYQNGVMRHSDASAPYSHSWAITSADNDSHSWTAKAYDAAGNNKVSGAVSITVNIGTASSGEHLWSQRFGGSRNDKGYSVAVDDLSGDVVLTGQFYGSVDFGGGTLPCAGSVNMVVARYTAEGTHLWSQCAEGVTGSVVGNAVAVDETTGDVVVTGSFTDTADFDGWSLTSDGMNDIFVAKYDGAGELQWVEQSGGYSDDRGRGIVIDGSGEVVVTGFFQNPDAIFVAKYTPEGVLLWLKRFTGYGTNMGQAITVDAADNIVVAGNFYGSVDFGGGPLTSASSWFPDVFVAKYSVNGEHIWSQRFGSDDEEYAYGVAVDDSSGDIALIGSFTGTVDFGGAALTSAGSYDIFVAKLRGSNGGHQWSQRFGGMGNEIGTGVAIDESGNIALIGSFTGTVDFGGPALTSHGGNDVIVAKYSPDGGHVWSKGFGGSWADSGAGVAVNAGGDLSLTGCFTGTADFGGGQLTGEGYYYDIFLVNLAP